MSAHRRPARAGAVLAAALTSVALTATAALAQWTTTGRGSGSVTTTTMNAPTNVSATSAGSVSWTASSVGGGAIAPSSYRVERSNVANPDDGVRSWSTACASPATSPCTDSSFPTAAGTYRFTYRVVALRTGTLGSFWTATSASSPVVTVTVSNPLTVSTLSLNNVASGGTQGKIEKGDSIVVTFSDAVRPQSVCSDLTSSSSPQTLGGGGATNGAFTLRLKDNAAAPVTTNDQITLLANSSACGGAVNLGTLDLGRSDWTSATASFSGSGGNATTLGLSGDHKTITVLVGNGTTTPSTAIPSATSTFTPSAGIKDDATNSTAASSSKTTTTRF